jgi:hypothetical protein
MPVVSWRHPHCPRNQSYPKHDQASEVNAKVTLHISNLNKGETITFQGHQYSVHMTCIPYFASQHDVLVMKKALFGRGANGGICGDNMVVLEGSKRFFDVFGVARHKVSQLRILTAQALTATQRKYYCYIPSNGVIRKGEEYLILASDRSLWRGHQRSTSVVIW